MRGRALEGVGFAYELDATTKPAERAKWLDEAQKAFGELEKDDAPGFKELAMYHQARVMEAKGDKPGAIELLKKLHGKLSDTRKPDEPDSFPYLDTAESDRLASLDPSAVPHKAAPKPGGAGGLGPAGIEDLLGPDGKIDMNDPRVQAFIQQMQQSQGGRPPGGQGDGAAAPSGSGEDVNRAALAIGVWFLTIGGCGTPESSNDHVNSAQQPLWMHRMSGALGVVAQTALTVPSRMIGEDYERGRAAIDAPRGRIFMGASDRGMYALRANDLSTIWRFETAGPVQSEPLYDAELDYVYFGSHDGALYCVRASDGVLVWRFSSGAEVAKKPQISGETLFFANGADNVFAVDRRSGKTKWNQHRTPALGMEISGYAGPTYDQGRVFMAYSDGHVIAYDARDGTEVWPQAMDLAGEAETAAGGETPRYLDVDTTPVVDELPSGRVIYVAGYAGGVFALSADSGAPVWKNEQATGVTDVFLWREPAHLPNPHGPDHGLPIVPERKYVIASSATSGLWALEAATGKKIWDVPIPDGGVTAPAAVAGALLVGTTRYGLFLISPINGRVIDGIDMGSGFSQAPAAFGDRAYAITNAGTLLALQVTPPEPEHR